MLNFNQKWYLNSDNSEPLILYCYEDFRKWYLSLRDLSMFSESEIDELLQDEKPDTYPCVPLILEGGLETYYISGELLEMILKERK